MMPFLGADEPKGLEGQGVGDLASRRATFKATFGKK